MEIAGFTAVVVIVTFGLWLKFRRHTGMGRDWVEEGGVPGSEES